MPKQLMPNTSVLVGPKWTPGIVMFTDDEGVHVMCEDGEYAAHSMGAIAVRGDDLEPDEGDEVLVELGDGWQRGTVLDVHVGRVRVAVRGSGEHWVPPQGLALILAEPESKKTAKSDSGEGEDAGLKQDFGTRSERFGWRWGSLVVLGFGALAPVFAVVEGVGWVVSVEWLALHMILAAYVHAQNRPLPRFHPAGFGKPSDPMVFDKSVVVEHPPMRGKWEMVVMLIGGWMILGLGAGLPGMSPWIGSGYVGVVGVLAALLAYLYDRHSAVEVRRLLGAKPIRDGADTGEGCVVGTVSGTREDEPALWREILLYAWSESRQVTKQITDSEGRTQTVQATETSHYSCGLRRERDRSELRLDTSAGPVEVPLRGSVWAAERGLSFGRRPGKSQKWQRSSNEGIDTAHARAAVLEQIQPQDRVAVVGELRRGTDGRSQMIGGKQGPTLLFAAGEREPLAVLRRDLLRRRGLIVAMVLLGAAAVLTAALVG